MNTRRHFLMAAACAASAGAAYAFTPRRRLSLVGDAKLSDIIPTHFGDWSSREIGDPLALQSDDSLSAKLYNQLLTRLYVSNRSGAEIQMLMAYGAEQTDGLQLHRPEVCYPAFGFKLARNEGLQIPLAQGVAIPARRLWAVAEGRDECIVYWSRIGETLPSNGHQQRIDRLQIAFQGVIPDGVLSRFSIVSSEPDIAWRQLTEFVSAMVLAVRPGSRQALIGTERAQTIRAIQTS